MDSGLGTRDSGLGKSGVPLGGVIPSAARDLACPRRSLATLGMTHFGMQVRAVAKVEEGNE